MKHTILLSKIWLLSQSKATELFENYNKKIGFKNFAEQQKALDTLTQKTTELKGIKEEYFHKAFMYLNMMATRKDEWSAAAFENLKKYPTIIWIECIGNMDSNDILSLLKNYHLEFNSILIEICIANLSEDKQLSTLNKYQKEINPQDFLFPTFYYSVNTETRTRLQELFPDYVQDDILLELQDLDEDKLLETMLSEQDRLNKTNPDDLVELVLLKATKSSTLNSFFSLFNKIIEKCSPIKFKFLITRYKYLVLNQRNTSYYYDDEEETTENLSDIDLIKLFKKRFHEIGIDETLSLFNHENSYGINNFTVEIIIEFLDIASNDLNSSKYVNKETKIEIINRLVTKYSQKEYSLEEFEKLVSKIDSTSKPKLVFDDYIEAIIACGKLLKSGIINDKNSLFLELRNKFTKLMLNACQKDGTYNENISLNGIFYRLAKGSMPFDKVLLTNTYRGLIYLSKSGQLVDNADYKTQFLTDEQLAKLNISQVLKWNNSLSRTNTKSDSLSFVERMGLQLLIFFGHDRAKYLLELNMQGNRMENLFDGLNYKSITINEDGSQNLNHELIDFLFGRGSIKETNSVINRMVRGEIPEFEKHFTEFCNSYDEVKKACNGVLTVKRIVNYYNRAKLPIELKPDEIEFEKALKEMNTMNKDLLQEGLNLCKNARERTYSSIPKIKGNLGDFTYEILDLADPFALDVGYLSHCCFVVKGISYSALKHSMQSPNGRTFVVYYKGHFLTQSWVWRNGDVICFDSVEAGAPYHSMYNDDIKLVDVYKKAANELFNISNEEESNEQKVKVVTIGKSDYTFSDLKPFPDPVPTPLERNLYAYDSSIQNILAGSIPEKIRYGDVEKHYKDPRRKVTKINDLKKIDIDLLDETLLFVNSLRYRLNNTTEPVDTSNLAKIFCGTGWYILIAKNGQVEYGCLNNDEETIAEYSKYASVIEDAKLTNLEKDEIKKLGKHPNN